MPRAISGLLNWAVRAAPGFCGLGLLIVASAGCSNTVSGFWGRTPEAPPRERPESIASPPANSTPSSLELFYADVERKLIAAGRMRRDTAPADAPYSVDDLVRNFERIALYQEYSQNDGRFVQGETPGILHRWVKPIRVGVLSGASVSEESAARNRANVAGFSRRLSRLTGHDMRLAPASDQVNFLVMFLNSDETAAMAAKVRENFDAFTPAVLSSIADTPVDTFCTTYAFPDPAAKATYASVMIIIRAEHPPLTRLSCVHEEMAQAMGLPNDSDDARPSLFNDELEFALLTEHDETLLRMLYDPALAPGMRAEDVRELLPDIAQRAVAAQNQEDAAGSAARLN